MRRLAAKLAFVHRALWQRDAVYRWAVLIGPPPVLGCAVAAMLLAVAQLVWHGGSARPAGDAPWAHWQRPVEEPDRPLDLAPDATLPRTDSAGRFVGVQTGWAVDIHPMLVDAVMDANVTAPVVTSFTLGGAAIPLDRIVDAGPPSGLFVGAAQGFLVVRAAGLYALSLRLTRSGPKSADCLVRFGVTRQRLIRSLSMNTNRPVLDYRATEMRLTPGLLGVYAAVGCWRGDAMVGSGELTLMVRHPGEVTLQPARDDEVVREVARPEK